MRLAYVLGDQLHPRNPALGPPSDTHVLMAEVAAEADRHANHKQRLALFFAAMRHWADDRRRDGYTVRYHALDDPDAPHDLADALTRALHDHAYDEVAVVEPGRLALRDALQRTCDDAGVPLRVVSDDHFFCSLDDFEAWADGRRAFVMEHFYRWQRRRLGILMNGDDPVGGRWNFDDQNRDAFGADGPPDIKPPIQFRPDDTTQAVLDLVDQRFPDNPGALAPFEWPVTHDEALRATRDFVEHRLPHFGTFQDAMWTGRPFLYHARLSAALNLKLVDPLYVIMKAVDAYHDGHAPLNAVEGFVRQIIGWREYMRGLYYTFPDRFLDANALDAHHDLPPLYWDGKTDMACLEDVVGQLLDTAYAHHIQRLMVAGLFALLYGVRPHAVHDWFMALYADSVEWVTLPNVVGMSQHADGGLTASKPYVASGNYIRRQSNYCAACRFDPRQATGDDACPFTTLYWDFLHRHADRFRDHRRMALQVKNLDRKSPDELHAIATRAEDVRAAARDGTL
ncbi:MAG: cryptochrome/photolyase family protein [Rubricoccaceae bacterium]|nr:cryptochrome/photolyase family protein [Rubricoccaceae bacterium]